MNRASQASASVPAQSSRSRSGPALAGSRAALIIGVVAVVFGFLVGRFNPLLNHAASVEGATVDMLFSIMLGVAGTIFAIVEGALLFSILTYRHRGSDDSDEDDIVPIHGHAGLEILWSVIPAVLVTATAIGSYFVLAANELPQPNAMTIDVTGRQFSWQFDYPSLDVKSTELRLPLGQQVLVRLHSADVIHQFWIPAFRIKRDVMPDRVTEIRFTPKQEGTYPLRCTKICGVGHSAMVANVIVMKPADFDAWLAQQANGAPLVKGGAGGDPLARGRQIFSEQGCNACHALKDANAKGVVGPALDGIGTKAGNIIKDPGYKGQAKSGDDYIRESIVSPNAYIVPGFAANVMPQDFGKRLSPDDLNALVQYLSAQK